MDLGDYKSELGARWSRDRDLVPETGIPEREEHSPSRVRVEVAVSERPGNRRPRKMKREVLRRLLVDGVANEVALGDRKVDPETWHLDAIAVWDRTDGRYRRR